ncbi:MAG TPA: hypothetical protein VHQ45_00210, partial [Gemmatimonadaceae bacterium]|nr:hypothetical protein [Gemmatimonadaceae bacterium]
SVSPDGRYVAFYSSRDLFGFALLVADVHTGRVVKELQGVTSDAHYDQLAFIASAGSWSPDGRKLAFVVYAKGDNEIDILDIGSRRVERRIHLSDVGAVNDPAWSPDGRRIAFSGSRGGISDLYVMDLETGTSRQLTEGRYAEIQPQWSPDGQSIVFVTDRGEGTDFGELRYGPMRLATMNADGSDVRLLPTIGNGKHVDPQFSPDGRSLYFLSDVDGFSDIYRYSIPEKAMYRVTRVATGVSGITQYSPAMSISRATGELLFSVFNKAGYGIRALDSLAARGVPVQPAQPEIAAAVTTDSTAAVGAAIGGSNALGRNPAVAGILPPAAALATSIVNSYLNQPLRGLPPEGTAFALQPYRPRLRLDYLGVPAAGVTFGTYGTSLQGAVAGYFSDELNNRTISAVVQAQGELKDIGASLAYINRERRWNWLTGVSHAPWMSIASGVKDTLLNDGTVPAFQSQLLLQRQYNDEAFAAVAYPISMTRRWEFGTGYQHTSYSSELITETFVDNSLVLRRRDDLPNPPSIQLGRVNAAFVGDHSFFGFVSPVAGGRYRLEVSPVFGTLNFTTGLADYRRYMFKKPVTFAVRGLFFGRFGRNAEDSRLQPLYLGQTTLIRGYDIWNDFNGTECTQTAGSNSCPELDRLIGSRVGVASAELRLPLFGVQQFGILAVPFVPPTELSFFVEGGTAWNKDESPVFKFATRSTERIPVFSAGVSARINLFGFAVGEVFYAYPFQRPDKGAHFGFQLAPGW